jgi:hypothetical protein
MSTQSAAESLIHEFVSSGEFESGLHEFFMQPGNVRPENLLGILRQFVNSPSCEAAINAFWRAPSQKGPEHQFDN